MNISGQAYRVPSVQHWLDDNMSVTVSHSPNFVYVWECQPQQGIHEYYPFSERTTVRISGNLVAKRQAPPPARTHTHSTSQTDVCTYWSLWCEEWVWQPEQDIPPERQSDKNSINPLRVHEILITASVFKKIYEAQFGDSHPMHMTIKTVTGTSESRFCELSITAHLDFVSGM